MERVGICQYMGRVSPVLDVANNLRIFEVEHGRFRDLGEKLLVGRSPFTRAQEVSSHNLNTVVCGAVSRPLQQALHALGVTVVGFICGGIEEVIRAWAEGRLNNEKFLMPGCCGRSDFVNRLAEIRLNQPLRTEVLKVAVASVDGTIDGMVDECFGRCTKLVIYTPDSNAIKVIDNEPNTGSPQNAGIQTVQTVVNAGAHAVIGSDFGPQAFHMLRAAGIAIYSAMHMTVKEALALFKEGKLRKLGGEDVRSRK
jgi:predicted Fe-Mo cluster-binding NifX family protein